MLMAAGLGTRLRPFTETEPKALVPVMGLPIAQFAVDAAIEAGVRRIVANVHHHAEKTCAGLATLEMGSAELAISDESELLLGSAGGIRKALPLLGSEPFFLLNADVLIDIDLEALAAQHLHLRKKFGVVMTFAVFPKAPGTGRYREILLDSAGERVTGIGPQATGRPFFIGAAVMEPDALKHVPSSGPAESIPTIFEPAIQEGRAGVHLCQGSWYDVGSPALWLEAHLGLIEALETGRISARWRKRLESANKRIAPGIWVSSDCRRCSPAHGWGAPSYWNPSNDSTAEPPRFLGPRGVLYGHLPAGNSDDAVYRSGIGFVGHWAAV